MIAVLSTSLIPLGWRIEMTGWAVIYPLMYVNLLETPQLVSLCYLTQTRRSRTYIIPCE